MQFGTSSAALFSLAGSNSLHFSIQCNFSRCCPAHGAPSSFLGVQEQLGRFSIFRSPRGAARLVGSTDPLVLWPPWRRRGHGDGHGGHGFQRRWRWRQWWRQGSRSQCWKRHWIGHLAEKMVEHELLGEVGVSAKYLGMYNCTYAKSFDVI